MPQVGLGIVGCGKISEAYLTGAARSRIVAVKSVTDLNHQAAAAKAEKYGVEAVTFEHMLDDPEIAIVIDLTVPAAHAEVNLRAITAGKHVYSEKPFAVTFGEARELMAAAGVSGVRIGSAPDTFLGAGHQTARRLIDEGRIGTVTGGAAMFSTPGSESWHPSPFFLFRRGGGPVLDIGCYPITQLVNCLGPVNSVVAHGSKGRETRTVATGPHAGTEMAVEVFTTVNGALAFASGANVAFTVSWDVWKHQRNPIEIYGTAGTLINPDPNFFDGEVLVSAQAGDWVSVPIDAQPFSALTRTLRDGREVADYRMAGVFDMAAAIAAGRRHRASGELALHVLEVMEGLERSSLEDRRISMETTCARPAPVPPGAGEEVFLAAG